MKNFLRMGVAAMAGLLAGAAASLPAMPPAIDYTAPPPVRSRSRWIGKPGRAGAKLAKQAAKARVGLRTSAR